MQTMSQSNCENEDVSMCRFDSVTDVVSQVSLVIFVLRYVCTMEGRYMPCPSSLVNAPQLATTAW
jgi:hypothetical protein